MCSKKNDYLLSQKAMQMWVLLRSFPFIVAEKIDREDEHINLILLLRIMEIVLTKSNKIIDAISKNLDKGFDCALVFAFV